MRFTLTLLLLAGLVMPAAALEVDFAWDLTQLPAPAAQVTGFFLYRQVDCQGVFTKLNSTPIPVGTLTYADSTVVAGKTYCWQVTSVTATGEESGASNTVQFQVPQGPPAPSNLRGTVKK